MHKLSVVACLKKKEEKQLLRDISCRVFGASIVALMGPSGAGKTTLLNRIAGRGFSGQVDGDITYNGRPLKSVKNQVGYVTQDDIMYEMLTPRQNLMFAAEFLRSRVSAAERKALVDDVITRLRLGKCADTIVGTPGITKGISGGERKRTNVGLSLLGAPSLLLLDEPTSGLDSKMSMELAVDLQHVANLGCTVVATIHQPSEAVFHCFTNVLMLESGEMAYFGPVEALRPKLDSIGVCSPETPLPELLLDCVDDKEVVEKLRQFTEVGEKAARVVEAATESDVVRASFCSALWILVRRNAVVVRNSKPLMLVRVVQTVLSTIVIAWIFKEIGVERDLQAVRSLMFVIFLLGFAQFLFALLGVVNVFTGLRAVFLREAQDHLYHPAAFFIAQSSVDTLVQSYPPILTTLISTWIISMNDETVAHVLLFYVIVALSSNVGAAMGFVVSASAPNVNVALSIAPGLVMPQLLLSGLFLPIELLPQPFHVMSYLSVARYLMQGVVSNEFNCDTDVACDSRWRTYSGANCKESPCDFCCTYEEMVAMQGVCPVITCEDALSYLNLDAKSIWPSGESPSTTVAYSILTLAVLLVFFRLVGLLVLLISYKMSTRSPHSHSETNRAQRCEIH